MARHRSRRHRMRGGGGAADYSMQVNGSADAQYARVFGPEYPNVQGNAIIGAQGQNAVLVNAPTPAQLNRIQSGGRKRRFRGSKRGGFLGETVSQALVPFALLGMQQTYRRRRGGSRRTHKRRRH